MMVLMEKLIEYNERIVSIMVISCVVFLLLMKKFIIFLVKFSVSKLLDMMKDFIMMMGCCFFYFDVDLLVIILIMGWIISFDNGFVI